jgi:hypothetical protein
MHASVDAVAGGCLLQKTVVNTSKVKKEIREYGSLQSYQELRFGTPFPKNIATSDIDQLFR